MDPGYLLRFIWNRIESAFGDGVNPRAELDHPAVAIDIFGRSPGGEQILSPDEIALVIDALKRARPATGMDGRLLVEPTRRMVVTFRDGGQLTIRYGEPSEKLHASLVVIRGEAFVVMSPVPPPFGV